MRSRNSPRRWKLWRLAPDAHLVRCSLRCAALSMEHLGMPFFARSHAGNGSDEPAPEHVAGAVAGPPPVGGSVMADQLARKMFGIGLSDINQAAEGVGKMLADFRDRLDRIEAAQAVIAAQLAQLLERNNRVQKP